MTAARQLGAKGKLSGYARGGIEPPDRTTDTALLRRFPKTAHRCNATTIVVYRQRSPSLRLIVWFPTYRGGRPMVTGLLIAVSLLAISLLLMAALLWTAPGETFPGEYEGPLSPTKYHDI